MIDCVLIDNRISRNHLRSVESVFDRPGYEIRLAAYLASASFVPANVRCRLLKLQTKAFVLKAEPQESQIADKQLSESSGSTKKHS